MPKRLLILIEIPGSKIIIAPKTQAKTQTKDSLMPSWPFLILITTLYKETDIKIKKTN